MQSGDTNGESPGVVTGKATESVSKWPPAHKPHLMPLE